MQQASTRARGGDDSKLASAVKRKGQPEEVAELILWLLSDSSTFITGTVQVSCDFVGCCGRCRWHLLTRSMCRSSMAAMSVEDCVDVR